MNETKVKVCIIGAGIVGLSSAYRIACEYPGCDIKIITAETHPDITSSHSFGTIWLTDASFPSYSCPRNVERTQFTFRRCMELLNNQPDLAKEMGIQINYGYHIFDGLQNIDELNLSTCMNFRRATNEEINYEKFFDRLHEFGTILDHEDSKPEDIAVYRYGMIAIDPNLYLPWLLKQLRLMASKKQIGKYEIVKMKVENLNEVCDGAYDFVVNCSGFGSKKLAKDNKLIPIKGQYVVCQRSCDNMMFYACNKPFICPLSDRVLIGSTFDIGKDGVDVDDKVTENLIAEAAVLWPKVRENVVSVYAAVRPGRIGGTRLEVENVLGGITHVSVPVIHNYGHGAGGVMTHLGCAEEVVQISKIIMKRNSC